MPFLRSYDSEAFDDEKLPSFSTRRYHNIDDCNIEAVILAVAAEQQVWNNALANLKAKGDWSEVLRMLEQRKITCVYP